MSGTTPTTAPLHNFPSLTTRQVAERLRIHEATVYRWLKLGTAPPSYKIGARRLFREADVLEWLENECRQDGR